MPKTSNAKPAPKPENSDISFELQPVFGSRSAFSILVELLNVLQTCRCRGSWNNQYVTPEAKRTIDRILTSTIPRKVNLNRLTKHELQELGFKPEVFNLLMTVWRIPIWLETCLETLSSGLPNQTEVTLTTNYTKGERRTWDTINTLQRQHADRGAQAKDHPHLCCGVLPGRAEEEKEEYDLKVTYSF